jgi:glycosyltransferase involved in cell wall biosynthesis
MSLSDRKFDRGISALCWAFNEEILIRDFLIRLNALLGDCAEDYEIVVVDDCSTDRTNEIVRKLQEEIPQIRLVRNETNLNVGYSCRRAITESRKEFLFWQTIDWAYDISDLRNYLELLKEYDVVAGVRRAPVKQRSALGKALAGLLFLLSRRHLTKRSDTVGKAFVSVCNYILIRVLFGVPLSDFQNVVFYRTAFVQNMEFEGKGSFLNPELLIKAYWSGSSIVEVPISFIPRTAGEAKGTRFKAIFTSVKDVFRLWFKWVVLGRRGEVNKGTIRRLESGGSR